MINLPKKITVFAISLYQSSLSPDHGWFKGRFPHGYCRYYPSCSEYSKQAINGHGLTKGAYLSVKRLLRCHPWAEPGVDLVPGIKS